MMRIRDAFLRSLEALKVGGVDGAKSFDLRSLFHGEATCGLDFYVVKRKRQGLGIAGWRKK